MYMLEIISRFFDKGQSQRDTGEPVIVTSEYHSLSPKMISRDARKVVEVLQDAGYQAYVVGGAVRDLLLGLKAKDFDVVAAVRPKQGGVRQTRWRLDQHLSALADGRQTTVR